MDNIFEAASRQKIRFDSNRGALMVEQLWDLSLTSKSGFDLDSVARAINRDLKDMTEESFVATTSNPAKASLELKLEVVKYVIAIRMAENAARLAAADKAAKKTKLIEVLSRKQDAALEALTPDEIQAQIEELSK
jgi:hypothetical protein